MVGHCIRQLVNSIMAEDQLASDDIERAWEQLRDRQDRESLHRVLKAIVPTVKFYFSTRQ